MKKSWQEPTIFIVKTSDEVILASLQETGIDAGGWFTSGGEE